VRVAPVYPLQRRWPMQVVACAASWRVAASFEMLRTMSTFW
jgi:hypothetical protein